MKGDMANEAGYAATKAAPAVGVALASASGWGVQEWMYAATLLYVLMQAAYLLWKWHREWRARRG